MLIDVVLLRPAPLTCFALPAVGSIVSSSFTRLSASTSARFDD